MPTTLYAFMLQLGVYLLVACLPVSFTPAQAQSQNLPEGFESYLDRPEVLKLPAEPQDLGRDWEVLKKAHLTFVAQLLETYPKDTHIYLLARDSEYLFDFAKLATKGTPDASRIHLINVSRANMRDKNLKAYLAENGISDQTLDAGRKVLFVDTGFAGTIPGVIGDSFTQERREKLKTHLIVSDNPRHPSSRSFLLHLNPTVNENAPRSMHGSIVAYEYMPRYTDRSSKYVFGKGRHQPVSVLSDSKKVTSGSDGAVSKEISTKYMKDLAAEWAKPEVRSRFANERKEFRAVRAVLSGDSPARAELLAKLMAATQNVKKKRAWEAKVRDYVESAGNLDEELKFGLADFNLTEHVTEGQTEIPKKQLMMAMYPEWTPILENPDDRIPELFEQNSWQLIGSIIDANVDNEINSIIVKNLFKIKASGIQRSLQLGMIEKPAYTNIIDEIGTVLLKTSSENRSDHLMAKVIGKADDTSVKGWLREFFSKPFDAALDQYLETIIHRYAEKEFYDQYTMEFAIRYTFSESHMLRRPDLLERVIRTATQNTQDDVAEHIFSKPHWIARTDLLRILVEKIEKPWVVKSLEKHVFSKPEGQTPLHIALRDSLEIEDLVKRKEFLETKFWKPPTVTRANRAAPSARSFSCKDLF